MVYPSRQRFLSFWLDKRLRYEALGTRATNKKIQTLVEQLFSNLKHT